MLQTHPVRSPTAEAPQQPSLLWTIALAGALIGLVAMPRRDRQGRDPQGRDPQATGPGAAKAPVQASPSHEGADAHDVAHSEADRGRKAASPTEIPAKGWKDVAMRTYRDIGENRIMLISAGVTFFALLAIFPAIAALVSVYGLVADIGTINDNLASLQGIVPSGALDIIGDQVKRITEKGNATLGLTVFTGIALSVWSANGGMKHVFDALNVVYNEREKRNFVVLNLVSLGFTAGALLFIVLALAAIVVLPIAFRFVGISSDAWYVALLRWPLLLLAVLGGLALLYRYGPSRDAPRWRWVSTGSLAAAILWLGGSLLFSWYVANFGKYNQTYGSLGAAIGFMTWIWLSTTIVLLGAQINAETEHQTAEDTTVGTPRDLGDRKARMADTVGVASD